MIPSRSRARHRALSRVLPVLLAAPLASPASAQTKEDWRQPTFSNRLVLDSQNNTCVDGFEPGTDFVAEKFSPDGTELWSSSFGHPTINESVNWLAVDSEDAMILTGHMAGPTGGLLTVKFSADGDVLWSDIQNVNSGEAYRVEVDAADNIYVLGVTFDFQDNFDFYLVKYSPAGSVLWTRQKSFGPGSFDAPRALAVTPAGRVAATGQVGSNDFGTVAYDADGNELFASVYLPGKIGAQDVLIAPDGSVYVCGMGAGNLGVVVRYDAGGAELWDAEISNDDIWFARMNKLALDPAGNVVAAGYGNAPDSSFMDWLVAKVDPSGTPLWTRTYGNYETWDEWIRALTTGPEGEVYVAGSAGVPGCSPGTTGVATAVIRYDADGGIDWLHEASCTGAWPNSIALDSTGEIVFNTGPGDIIRLVQESWMTLGAALAGSNGIPALDAEGYLESQQTVDFTLENAVPAAIGWHIVGTTRVDLPLLGGVLVPTPLILVPFVVDGAGQSAWSAQVPAAVTATFALYVQSWIVDPAAVAGFCASNAVTKVLQ